MTSLLICWPLPLDPRSAILLLQSNFNCFCIQISLACPDSSWRMAPRVSRSSSAVSCAPSVPRWAMAVAFVFPDTRNKKTSLQFSIEFPVESFGAYGATKNIACVKSKERDFSHLPTLHAAVVAFVSLLTPGHEVPAGLLDLHWRAKEALHLWGCSTRPDATRYHWYQGGLVELGCFNQLREIRETCQAVFFAHFFLTPAREIYLRPLSLFKLFWCQLSTQSALLLWL